MQQIRTPTRDRSTGAGKREITREGESERREERGNMSALLRELAEDKRGERREGKREREIKRERVKGERRGER